MPFLGFCVYAITGISNSIAILANVSYNFQDHSSALFYGPSNVQKIKYIILIYNPLTLLRVYLINAIPEIRSVV